MPHKTKIHFTFIAPIYTNEYSAIYHGLEVRRPRSRKSKRISMHR